VKSEKGLSLQELIQQLCERVGSQEGAAKAEELKADPRFQKLIEALLEGGERSDVEREARDKGTRGQGDKETRRQGDPLPISLSPHPPIPPSPPRRLAVFYSPEHEGHISDEYPVEAPQRVEAILSTLRQKRLLDEPSCTLQVASPATTEDLTTVHRQAYVDFVRRYAAKGGGGLSRNTYVARGSWEAALGAAGCALAAGEALRQGYDFAWALTRPAGHHAGPDFHGGFCLFNNAAILAHRLREEGKVMVLNWDVHASNGTKRIFYGDPQVLTVSLHQDPTHFFPREGFAEEIGAGAGKGYSVNVPLPPGSGDERYLAAFAAIVEPIFRQFAPDWLIVECGFDAHHQDPLGGQKLTSQGYYQMAERLLGLRPTGIVFTLEGGYNVNTIGPLASTLVCALLGEANSFPDELPREAMGRGDALSYSLVKGMKGVGEKRSPGGVSLEKVIQEVRQALRGHWQLLV